MVSWSPQNVATMASLLTASKHSFHASFTLLIWDHVVTLGQEIDRIWSQPWNAHKILFLMNRYISPTQYVLQLLTLDLPQFSGAKCDVIYRLPYASTLYATALAEIILIIRTYALFGLSKRVLILLSLLFIAHVSVMIAAVIKAERYPLPPGLIGCTLTGSGMLFVFFWGSPWIADTTIFALTLWKTIYYRKSLGQGGKVVEPLLTVLARDGFLFYFVIFAIDTVNVAIFLLADKGVKPMGAAFCQVLTTVMVSRLQLNLRSPEVTRPCSHSRAAVESILENGGNGYGSKCKKGELSDCNRQRSDKGENERVEKGALTTLHSFLLSNESFDVDHESKQTLSKNEEGDAEGVEPVPRPEESSVRETSLQAAPSSGTPRTVRNLNAGSLSNPNVNHNISYWRTWFESHIRSLGGPVDDDAFPLSMRSVDDNFVGGQDAVTPSFISSSYSLYDGNTEREWTELEGNLESGLATSDMDVMKPRRLIPARRSGREPRYPPCGPPALPLPALPTQSNPPTPFPHPSTLAPPKCHSSRSLHTRQPKIFPNTRLTSSLNLELEKRIALDYEHCWLGTSSRNSGIATPTRKSSAPDLTNRGSSLADDCVYPPATTLTSFEMHELGHRARHVSIVDSNLDHAFEAKQAVSTPSMVPKIWSSGSGSLPLHSGIPILSQDEE